MDNTIPNHIEYDSSMPIWDYMRDAWLGEKAMKCNAKLKGYIWEKEGMGERNFDFMVFNGRYPEIVSRLIKSNVSRSLIREPHGYEQLSKITDNPKELLTWMLTETAIVGGFGIALNLQEKIRAVTYTLENIPNWSDHSIAFRDRRDILDEFGFMEDYEEVINIVHLDDQGFANMTVMDSEGTNNPVKFAWNGMPLNFIPAVRVNTLYKPLFHGLAESAEHYFRTSATRMFILNLIVPQPVLTMPPEEEFSNWKMEDMLEEGSKGKLQYGAGSFMKLPHGSTFDIKSVSVRNLAEFRQELYLIKDEMVVQGAQLNLQRAGQITNMSDDTIRLHINEESLLFDDVRCQVEDAVNQIMIMYSNLTNEPYVPFKFKEVDMTDVNVKELVEASGVIGEENVREELYQQSIGIEDKIDELMEKMKNA